jgi:ribosomal-protein-serine acetyltransferase
MLDLQLSLRPWRPEDAPQLFEAVSESAAELGPWSPWWTPAFDQAAALIFIQGTIDARPKGEAHELAIVGTDGRDEQILGSCGINEIRAMHGVANLGYWVRSSHTGSGIATAIVKQLSAWVFDNMQLNRLELVIASENLASLRVAQKAGANHEGRQKSRLLLHGSTHDAEMFAICRD